MCIIYSIIDYTVEKRHCKLELLTLCVLIMLLIMVHCGKNLVLQVGTKCIILMLLITQFYKKGLQVGTTCFVYNVIDHSVIKIFLRL